MTNPAEDLAVLRETSDVLLQQSDEARRRVTAVRAQDESGEVQVRLEAGGRLEAVQVGFSWSDRLDVDELLAGVLEALTRARAACFEQYGEAMQAVESEPEPRARPTPTTSPVIDRFHDRLDQSGQDPQAAADLVVQLLSDADLALAEANRIVDDHAGREFTGRSRSRRVTATAAGSGELLSLDVDRDWVHTTHPANLGREITQAVRDAGERAQRDGLLAALKASKLAQMAQAFTDQAEAG